MQLTHYDYLPERFLHQICRVYSKSIPKGEDYSGLLPVIHIAILDCDLFPNGDPRNTDDFISQYYVMETKNHQIYSGNFHMDVVSLKNIENAEEKEDPNGIYQWAKLLKAVTWEEFNMIAENNSYMESIATSVCALCNDPKFVEECERRMRNEWEYNSRMAEADRKGMARGMAQGMERGMAQGMAQGKAEDVMELLEELGDVSESLREMIMGQRELEILKNWHKLAAKAQSVEDFCVKTGIKDF